MWQGDDQAQAVTRELRFTAIELGQSPVLGRDVRVELAPGTTSAAGPCMTRVKTTHEALTCSSRASAACKSSRHMLHIKPGMLRGDGERRELTIPHAVGRWMNSPDAVSRRQIGFLLHTLVRWHEGDSAAFSTHSPQVVSWARPDAIRLVERSGGATQVRGLGERTIKHAQECVLDRTAGLLYHRSMMV